MASEIGPHSGETRAGSWTAAAASSVAALRLLRLTQWSRLKQMDPLIWSDPRRGSIAWWNGLDGKGNQLRDEQTMIALILKGDMASFQELIRPYQRRVFTMAFSILHNEEDAEDTAQEAFIKAFWNLARFRGEAKFSSWLISITLNEARSRYRRKAFIRFESRDACSEDAQCLPAAILRDSRETASQTLQRLELRQLLQEAISTLPPIYRQVVILRYLEELSVAETAAVLNISIAAIKVRLFRARFLMKKSLAPQLNPGHSRWR